MRDTLSTNGEHLRVAEVKSFPAILKSMRSVNGDQNGPNLKKWSVLLVRTIYCHYTLIPKVQCIRFECAAGRHFLQWDLLVISGYESHDQYQDPEILM